MLWAQSQIVGYQWAMKNPDLLQKISKSLKIKEVNEIDTCLNILGLFTYTILLMNRPFF